MHNFLIYLDDYIFYVSVLNNKSSTEIEFVEFTVRFILIHVYKYKIDLNLISKEVFKQVTPSNKELKPDFTNIYLACSYI